MLLTIIVPCYNEGSVLRIIYQRLNEVLGKDSMIKKYGYELIFIDDGSKDNTINILKELKTGDPHVKYISFTRNFGKEAGILAGLAYSLGDAVIILDADLQHPPELIPEMLYHYYRNGYNQVIAKRNRNGDPKSKIFLAKLYYKIVNYFIDIELSDGAGDFRLLSRRAVNALLSMPEYNRFSKGLFYWIGFDVKVIEYQNQCRINGTSKWNFRKLIQYGLDGILSFNNKPLRSTLYLGLLMVLAGILYILYSLGRVFAIGFDFPGYFTTITAILVMGGVQLISTGIIGEYIGRIYYEVKRRPHYLIKETNINSSFNSAEAGYFMEKNEISTFDSYQQIH